MQVNWPERLWVNSPLRRWVQRREALYFKEQHDMPVNGRCLEIGCGNGFGARLIAEAFSPSAIAATDIDPRMLRLARRKLDAWGMPQVRVHAADAQHLPYSSESFDGVFNFGIIHHLEDWQNGVREVARVLKPGGGFYFEEIYPPLYANPLFKHLLDHPRENRFHGPQFRGQLAKCGLELLPGYKESRFAILGIAVKNGDAPAIEKI
jgi:ubiquinone/menaquinone biosynthesis C-methylase UbiE